jgi:ketosteroid isomerase-like protein
VTAPNVELVRSVYRAVNDDDRDAFLAKMHPEVELATSGVYPDFRPTYVGREGALQYWEAARGVWEAFTIEIGRCEVVGDHVLAEVNQRVLGRDEIAVEHRWAHLFSIEDGLVRRVRAYLSWDEAVKEAGFERGAG